jgi:CRP/FNR family transcriptional regulator, cyclic AMP receptor protein
MEHVDTIRAIPLFAELRQQEVEKLAPLVERQSFVSGARIFAEGEPGGCIYLVDTGRVRISRTMPGLGEEALAILGPGSVFGEMAVLDQAHRSADALAHEDTELLVLDRKVLDELFHSDYELAYHILNAILRTVAGRLREMNEKLMTVFMMARFC